MDGNAFQKASARTINTDLTLFEQTEHALYGMASEVGEITGIYQKTFQGVPVDKDHVIKEIGDLMWFAAEYCTANDICFNEVMKANVEKLKKRYPNGFEVERSINRAEGDI